MTPGTILARRAADDAARTSYGKLVAILAARDRDIAAAEDALSKALVSALSVWPEQGVPHNPEGWLVTAACNRKKNAARAAGTRRRAEPELARRFDLPADEPEFADDRLRLMFGCARPAIDPAAHAPLILLGPRRKCPQDAEPDRCREHGVGPGLRQPARHLGGRRRRGRQA